MKNLFKNFSLILLYSSTCYAEYIMPGAVNVSTKTYLPRYSDFNNSGEYQYKISWQGISVATARIKVNNPDTDGIWKVSAGAKTSNWISTFYTLKFESESIFSRENFKPKQFISRQVENSKKKVKEVSFLNDGTIISDAYKNDQKEETIKFNSDNQTLDPISAAFLARSIEFKVGSKRSFDVFNGKHRFLITFHVESLEKIKINKNEEVECFTVWPEVVKLTDTEGEKRLKSAKIWITADEKREIMKIESKVLIGSIKAEFQKFIPQNNVTLVRAH